MTREPKQSHRALIVELTQRCNHDCLHCYNVWKNRTPYPAGELSTGETLSLLSRLLDQTHARLITLTGGEPTLRDDLPIIVDFLNDRGVAINLITNGSLLSEHAIDRLGPGRISNFELPLLSADRAIHDRMSGKPGAFDRATEALAELSLRGERVVGVFVATRLNLPTWRETAELGIALGLRALMFNRFNPGGKGSRHVDELQVSPRDLEAALDEADSMVEDYGLPVSCSIAMPPCLIDRKRYRHLTFGFCAAGLERAYYTVDPLGNMRPCNHSPTILGNLRQSTFKELISSRTLRDFVAAHPAFCAGCPLELACLGGCKAAAEACFGSPWETDPFLRAYADQARMPAREADNLSNGGPDDEQAMV